MSIQAPTELIKGNLVGKCFVTGAVFGVARRRAVLCEGIPFSSLLYCGADSRHVLWASLFAGDLRFTVCLPCMNFVAGAALWRCFMRLVFTSKTIIFGCHSHSCAYGILYNSMLPSSRHVAHTHTHTHTHQIRSDHITTMVGGPAYL